VIDLHYIHDLNLISARFHALDLDVETQCEQLLPLLDRAAVTDPLLQRIRIVTHVWPRPDDPVVLELRALAAATVDQVREYL
jgi:hypothetical protein